MATTRDRAGLGVGGNRSQLYASANWDERVFDRPEMFDLSRSPNKHVSFGGGGIHHCLGNQLARKQLAVIFDQLLPRHRGVRTAQPHGQHLLPRGEPPAGAVHAPDLTDNCHPRTVPTEG